MTAALIPKTLPAGRRRSQYRWTASEARTYMFSETALLNRNNDINKKADADGKDKPRFNRFCAEVGSLLRSWH
jgi:hypothetical protein